LEPAHDASHELAALIGPDSKAHHHSVVDGSYVGADDGGVVQFFLIFNFIVFPSNL
jgi:hypothetical protein